MDETESKGQLETLLENPVLFIGLLLVFGTLVVLIGLVGYLLILRDEIATQPTPIPTSPVQFVTPTPPQATTPSSGNPSVALLPVQGDSGTLVTVTGKNWNPNDIVVVRLDDPTGSQGVQPLFANVQIANNGTFIASFILQTNTGWENLSTVLVNAESSTTGQRVSAEFSIISPIPDASVTPSATSPPDDQPTISPTAPGSTPTPTTEYVPSPGEWEAQYYNNPDLIGSPLLVRNELRIDFDWGASAPASSLPVDGFSARWLRSYNLEPATYRFHLVADDGVRMWINEELIVDEWYASNPREIIADYQVLYYGGLPTVRIEYTDFAAGATISFWWERLAPLPGDDPPFYEWRSEYWPNPSLFGSPMFVGSDAAVNFDWGTGSPAAGLPSDNFSARWIRLVDFEPTNYRFYITVSDGARLWIDDFLLIDEWRDGVSREVTGDAIMSAGSHELRLEYYERTGEAVISLRWEKAPLATSTSSPTSTPTSPPTNTPSATSTSTATPTSTPSPTATSSPTVPLTSTFTPTPLPTDTPTPTPTTPTPTDTPTTTPTDTPTPTPTDTPTATPTP
jgi:hypothetical protein